MATERLYTLEEARQEIHRAKCRKFGHDYEIHTNYGQNEPQVISCSRCGATWGVIQHKEQGIGQA